MNSVLDYFISLQESQSADMNEQSVEMWNRILGKCTQKESKRK